MPKLIPVPDDVGKPFWDAVNERRLVVQNCPKCDTLQYPPKPACQDCGSEDLEWKETSGRGRISTYVVMMDIHLARRVDDQPFNLAFIELDDDPRINFFSNLPGVPVRDVSIGAAVEVTFEEVAPGQLIHEWRLAE